MIVRVCVCVCVCVCVRVFVCGGLTMRPRILFSEGYDILYYCEDDCHHADVTLLGAYLTWSVVLTVAPACRSALTTLGWS